jgi:hypothetical protein
MAGMAGMAEPYTARVSDFRGMAEVWQKSLEVWQSLIQQGFEEFAQKKPFSRHSRRRAWRL